MTKISTTILTAKNRIDSVNKLNKTTSDFLHIDIMDGKFVPNYQFPIDEVNNLKQYSIKPLDIHIMAEDPEYYINNIDSDNINNITFHIEIEKNIDDIIDLIKEKNYKVGIAIKPNTDINLIDKYINKIDIVLIMSVEPGFGGQSFNENAITRINEIRKKRKDIIIEVDGGINDKTYPKVKDIVDIAAIGSYITNREDYEKAIIDLKK